MSKIRHRKARLGIHAASVRRGRFLTVVTLLACATGCEDTPRATSEWEGPAAVETVRRIVSLSPVASRFVIEIGAGDRLVGVDPESGRLPELVELPIVDLPTTRSLDPDVVLLPDLASVDPRVVDDLESRGIRIAEFAPHDLEDAGALTRGLGAELVGVLAANGFERRFSRPLALLSEASPHLDRPRVAAVVDLDPLTLAGGHSFETDLIEIGGGTSVTHGGEDSSIVMTKARWTEFEPELVIVVTREAASPFEKQTARALIPARFPLAFFDYDRETFWLHGPEEEAERVRVLIVEAWVSRR